MAKHPQSKRHKRKAREHHRKAKGKESASDMGPTPNSQSPSHPKRPRDNSEYAPTPSEMMRRFVLCLRGFHLHREKSKITDWLVVALTLGVAIAAIWSAWIFQGQLSEARRQTKVARKTARISQRPWIGLSDEPGGGFVNTPLTIDEHGNVKFDYRIRTKNFGSFAAQGVASIAELIVGLSPNDVDGHQLCKGIPDAMGFVVYPGKDSAWNGSPALYQASDIKTDTRGQTRAFIVGCTVFRDEFNCHYYLRFGYEFVDNRFGNNVSFSFQPTPNSVPAGHFALYTSEMDTPPCPEQDD